jgi:nucleotide-binding universal stress UspA family protein
MHKRILVATHGGPAVDAALRVASSIAARQNDRVNVLAVLEPLPVFDAGFSPAVVPYDSFDRRRGEELLQRVRDQVKSVAGKEDAWPIELAVGSPSVEITRASRAEDVALVVMGIGRHAPQDRLFGGETALKVSRHSPVPVLAVAAGFDHLPKRALVGTDFSVSSLEAARGALRLLEAPASLTLAHVRPELEIPPVAYEEWQASYSRGVTESFLTLRAKLAAPKAIAVHNITLAGDPAIELLTYATRDNVDLIACGSHGHGFIERMLVGSVATKILRSAPCTVLLVPAAVEAIEEVPALAAPAPELALQ